jgi:chorismate dehydratase
MAAIDFLNPAPLMWDFEHEPGRTALAERYSIGYTTPANCAYQLDRGQADLGLVPVAAFAANPSLAVVPGCAIASLGQIRSILLVVRSKDGIAGVRRVAADTSSLASVAYAKILFERYWKTLAEFLPHPPGLEAMLAAADAAMLIGDPALLALEDRQGREERTGEKLLYLDLGEAWKAFTGLPWVSAFWALRPDALTETGISATRLIEDLQLSRDHGLMHTEELVAEWSGRIGVPPATIRAYLTTNIHYVLDRDCLAGLKVFYRYAAECGALPHAPPLRLL